MRCFGLDISDSVIRLAVLEKHGRDYRLPVRGEIPIPIGLINDGDILHTDRVADLIRQLLSAAQPRTKRAVVSLPERHSFIKSVVLPADQPVTVETVKDAVSPNLPYSWEEMTFDWVALPKASNKAETRILFGAAPKNIVTSYLDVLSRAGVEVVSMEIESIATARAVLPPGSMGGHILLDLGRTRASLILVNDGVVEFSTTIRYAGKDLNQYIADALHVNVEQAERAKELFGVDPARGQGLLAKVLAPQLDIMATKILSIQDFFIDHFPNRPTITSIMLNGGGALIRQIDQELSKRLNEPVSVQPAWVIKGRDPEEDRDLLYTYTTAIGLALQPFISIK